jgi:hypothetical protein
MSMMLISLFPLIMQVTPSDYESRTLDTGEPNDSRPSILVKERLVSKGLLRVVTHSIDADGSISYCEAKYLNDGTPMSISQEGAWGGRWNVFTSTYGPKGGVQDINGSRTPYKTDAKQFRDPTLLWFWNTHPHVGQTETVTFLAQNIITTFQIKFTYEADEMLDLCGKKLLCHRVREDPVGDKGVYTLWWYDDKGMGIKRFHKTTQHEFSYTLKAWR